MADKSALQPVKKNTVAWIALGSAIAGWLTTWFGDTFWWGVPVLPLTASFTLIALIVLLGALAIPLWLKSKGARSEPLNPMIASRTVILAQAALVLAPIVAGWHLGALLFLLPSWSSRPVHTPFYSCLTMIGLGVILGLLAWFTQQWAMIKDDNDTPTEDRV